MPFTAGQSDDLRIREGDSTGLSEIVFHRVSATYDFALTGFGEWVVSPDGGYPLALLENTGNSPSTISFMVLSLPVGWEALEMRVLF